MGLGILVRDFRGLHGLMQGLYAILGTSLGVRPWGYNPGTMEVMASGYCLVI